jgi:hypothetical protein
MLTVAAARLENVAANPKLVADLRAAADEMAKAHADGRGWSDDDQKRVERQRTLFQALTSSNATDRLKAAMLQRAYDLMWDGDPISCDVLAEFLPEADVDRMFAAWESDQEGKNPKSKFYEGER